MVGRDQLVTASRCVRMGLALEPFAEADLSGVSRLSGRRMRTSVGRDGLGQRGPDPASTHGRVTGKVAAVLTAPPASRHPICLWRQAATCSGLRKAVFSSWLWRVMRQRRSWPRNS